MLNQRNLTFAWVGSILLLSVFAGFSWLEVVLTPDAGGQTIEVTGYLAFPIISALVLLQGAALLASFFTPVMIGRWIAGLLAPVMMVHAVLVVLGLESAIAFSLAGSLSELTGVVGTDSQLQFVASSNGTILWVGYLVSIGVNLAVLIAKAWLSVGPANKPVQGDPIDDAGDLWESQK